jgi:8-oxo-dGTP diphosphatase
MPEDDFIKYPTGKIKKGGFCEKCGRYNARYTVANTIVVKESKVLLIKRANEPFLGYWALPGGYLSWDETVEECALRELKEETGYSAKKARLVWVNSSPKRDSEGRQNIEHFFIVEDAKKTGRYQEEEVSEIRWFSKDELPKKMISDHRKTILSLLP